MAAMATVACELHSAFSYFNWTGWYRAGAVGAAAAGSAAAAGAGDGGQQEQRVLVIGPYQGGLGCLRIPFSRGICGAAARTRQTQLVPDVHARPDHIACASSTQARESCFALASSHDLLGQRLGCGMVAHHCGISHI